MQKTVRIFLFMITVLIIGPSCNHNKIACPTYADSFPDAKKKKPASPDAKPSLPKVSKTKISHSMNPGGN